jgi:hypothetical protein
VSWDHRGSPGRFTIALKTNLAVSSAHLGPPVRVYTRHIACTLQAVSPSIITGSVHHTKLINQARIFPWNPGSGNPTNMPRGLHQRSTYRLIERFLLYCLFVAHIT